MTQPTPPPHIRRRIRELDALRGIAALMVVVFHYTTYYDKAFGHADSVGMRFWPGATGVSLFFIISGFVILMSLERTHHWKDFVVSRVSRLYPAYWCALIITSFAVFKSWDAMPWMQFVANLSMFQRWMRIENIDWSYWSLYVELAFYIAMLAVFAFRKIHKLEVWGLYLVLAIMPVNALMVLEPPGLSTVLVALPLLKWGHLFIAGIVFYRMREDGGSPRRHLTVVLCLVAEGFTRFNGNYSFLGFAAHMGIIAGYFGLFYLLLAGKLTGLAKRPLLFLGAISYSWYLVHQNLGYEIIHVLYRYTDKAYLIIGVPMLCTGVIATLITYAVEKPALRFIRARYRQRKPGSRLAKTG